METDFIFEGQEIFRHCTLLVSFYFTNMQFEFRLTDVIWKMCANTLLSKAVILLWGLCSFMLLYAYTDLKIPYKIKFRHQLCPQKSKISLFICDKWSRSRELLQGPSAWADGVIWILWRVQKTKNQIQKPSDVMLFALLDLLGTSYLFLSSSFQNWNANFMPVLS